VVPRRRRTMVRNLSLSAAGSPATQIGQAGGRRVGGGGAGFRGYGDKVLVDLQEVRNGLERAAEVLKADRNWGSVSSSSTWSHWIPISHARYSSRWSPARSSDRAATMPPSSPEVCSQ